MTDLPADQRDWLERHWLRINDAYASAHRGNGSAINALRADFESAYPGANFNRAVAEYDEMRLDEIRGDWNRRLDDLYAEDDDDTQPVKRFE